MAGLGFEFLIPVFEPLLFLRGGMGVWIEPRGVEACEVEHGRCFRQECGPVQTQGCTLVLGVAGRGCGLSAGLSVVLGSGRWDVTDTARASDA